MFVVIFRGNAVSRLGKAVSEANNNNNNNNSNNNNNKDLFASSIFYNGFSCYKKNFKNEEKC